MSEKNQKLVLSILEFLEQSINDGTIKEDDKEGIEVAIQCIGEAWGVDASDAAQRQRLSVKPATLQSIFDVYLKTKEKVGTKAAPAAPPKPTGPTESDKKLAEEHKTKGNKLMSSKDYKGAIAEYTLAVALDPTNAVYYSNRAAAHSSAGDHALAVGDARKAIEVDPKFVKGYHRLGHAYYCLEEWEESEEAFQNGLDIDPSNANLKSGRDNAAARKAEANPTPATSGSAPRTGPAATAGAGAGPDFSEVLRSLGGGGGGGGGAGGLDFASMLSNPAIMNMAQQMMGNGGLERMMQNPAISNMMDRVQSGGGMPSMAELMADPSLRQMADQFRNGGAGGGAPPGGA